MLLDSALDIAQHPFGHLAGRIEESYSHTGTALLHGNYHLLNDFNDDKRDRSSSATFYAE